MCALYGVNELMQVWVQMILKGTIMVTLIYKI